jgi:hypothetical protein
MRKTSGKTIRLSSADDQVTDHPARAGLEALMDQKLFAQRIKSERASAYWMAASLWGVAGLIIGAVLGAYMMYVAMGSSLPIASEAVSRGMAVERAVRNNEDREPALRDSQQQP